MVYIPEDAGGGAGSGGSAGDLPPWRILIIDDEPEVHKITHLALRDFRFAGRSLAFVSAYSAAEACTILRAQPTAFALVLIDVIMETDDAGLRVVRFLRETLGNKKTRIVLRTGQPGLHQERAVMVGFEIDDYKTKTELTKEKLESTMIAGLRAVGYIEQIEGLHDQLQHQQKLTTIGEFCMGIMHEIATPLSTILCINELLVEQAEAGSPKLEHLQKVQRASLRIKRLIDTLKDFTWTGTEDKRWASVAEMIQNALELCHYKITRCAVDVHVQVDTDATAYCWQRRTEQVLINLINNACDAMATSETKTLDIKGAVGPTGTTIDVQDSGPGVPPALREQIFASFFTTKPKGQGTGLGLFICRKVAEDHGGSFGLVDTDGPGTVFRLHLPPG